MSEPTIQQLFDDSSSALPDIALRPNSSAHSSRVHSATRRAVASSSQSSTPKKDGPLTPSQALNKFGHSLTTFEKDEIQAYSSIYFLGSKARKIHGSESKGNNFGYDDENGRYKCVKHDHVAYRYEILKGLGKGSFGDVIKAYDHKNGKHQALKIIRNQPRFHRQGQIEVRILEQLKKHDRRGSHNFIHINDWFVFRNHLCISFDLMHQDLYHALKKANFRGFTLEQVRSFATSLLSCLRLLRRQKVIHCDLKPENILLAQSQSDEIRVIDFGSACHENQTIHSYIQSRFYRAPEIILGQAYGMPIDMWSFGCILAELYTGQPIFPGKDEKEQLMFVMDVLGKPPVHMVRGSQAARYYDSAGNPKYMTDRKGRTHIPGSKPFATALGTQDQLFLDFISGCLKWDPAERMTPKEASKHPWIIGEQPSSSDSSRTSSGRVSRRVTAPTASTTAAPVMSSLANVVTVPTKSSRLPQAPGVSARKRTEMPAV